MRYGWWDDSAIGPWAGMFFGPFMMIIVIALAVLIVVWMVRAIAPGRSPDARRSSVLDILNERYARGEIDRKEYEERKQVLSGS
jgi:putative membrane protein